MRIIDRDSLDGISSAVVDGVVHNLGLVKDFHKNPVLEDFIADATRLSLSWVRLLPGEELAVHQHPTKSMIIVAEGAGLVNGDLSGPIASGDIVVVPSHARHGFVGGSRAGFWALSLQFEGGGLYEDLESPRVDFAGSDRAVDLVRAANQRHIDEYRRGALVSLVQDLDRQPGSVRERLLDYLQGWSDAFQRVVTARVVAETDAGSRLLAQEHLAEEQGHNQLLDRARAGRPGATPSFPRCPPGSSTGCRLLAASNGPSWRTLSWRPVAWSSMRLRCPHSLMANTSGCTTVPMPNTSTWVTARSRPDGTGRSMRCSRSCATAGRW